MKLPHEVVWYLQHFLDYEDEAKLRESVPILVCERRGTIGTHCTRTS